MKNRPLASVAALAAGAVITASTHAGCPGDIDGDGMTGFSDLLELLAAWGPCPGCAADIDGNGDVEFADLLTLLADWDANCTSLTIEHTELAGRTLSGYPWFTPQRTFSELGPINVAIDPVAHADVLDEFVFIYVVEARTMAEWDADGTLTDVRGLPQPHTFSGASIVDTQVALNVPIPGDGGLDFGVGYDVVIDVDGSGTLSDGDLIDGYQDEAGLYVIGEDITTEIGPLPTSSTIYSGGSFLGQITRYPTDIASMGALPLVVISHGNGHQYNWYAYLQRHLASRGYIVMSHQNNTVPGIETASTSTLQNTDYILDNLDTIAGGALQGHVDSSRIIWIGHSRGGEGVARAYDRIRDGSYNPTHYDLDDIILISSIAPTDFLGTASANPHEANYHLIYGSADGDVHGGADCDICQSFHLLERATGWRASTYVHGADHNDFNCCGFNDYCGFGGGCSGALQIGRPEAQNVAKAVYFGLLSAVVHDSPAAKDMLWRQYEDIRPLGVENDTVVDKEFKDGTANFVVDDYQTQTSTSTSSSGGAVTASVSSLNENRLNDINNAFTWSAADPMNGMTRARTSDTTRGTVFEWTSDSFLELAIIAGEADFSDDDFLSFRVAQGTRHPNTTAVNGDTTFTVTLRDTGGVTSSINIGVYGGGAEEPFARSGQGSGTGWANEFETIRIRLTDFLSDESGLDLTMIEAIRFEFGPSFGSDRGRLGLDDVELVSE